MPNFNLQTYYSTQILVSSQLNKGTNPSMENDAVSVNSLGFQPDSPLVTQEDTFLSLKSQINPSLSLYSLDREFSSKGIETLLKKQEKDTKDKLDQKSQLRTEVKVVSEIQQADKSHDLNSNWGLMGLLLFILFYAGILKFNFQTKLKEYVQALFRYQSLYNMFYEQNTNSIRLASALSILFSINMSVLLFYVNYQFEFVEMDYGYSAVFLIIMALTSLYSLVFLFINKIIRFLFEESILINGYLYNVRFINRIFSIVSIPFVVIYPFLEEPYTLICLYLALVVYLVLYLFRWYRGAQISFRNKLPIFYMILYLCTLEIIPVILIFKLVFSRG